MRCGIRGIYAYEQVTRGGRGIHATFLMDHPKIEKGIPIPKTSWNWLKDLEKGDSFLLAAGRIPTARDAARRLKIRIATRRENSNEFRVWRID